MDVGPVELLIVLAVVLLLFGSKKLPELAKGMGQAAKEFRSGLHDDDEAGAQGRRRRRPSRSRPSRRSRSTSPTPKSERRLPGSAELLDHPHRSRHVTPVCCRR